MHTTPTATDSVISSITALGRRIRARVDILDLADALDVHLLRLAQLAAVLALRHGAAFLFDFEEGAVGVLAGGGAVAFDACFAGGAEPGSRIPR